MENLTDKEKVELLFRLLQEKERRILQLEFELEMERTIFRTESVKPSSSKRDRLRVTFGQ